MAKIILMDWQRGKIPYFVLPPGMNDKNEPMSSGNLKSVVSENNQEDIDIDNKNKDHGISQDVNEIIITHQYEVADKTGK